MNFSNPSLHVGAYATSLASGAGVTVECAYFAGFITGVESKTRNPRAFSSTKSLTTTNTNILTVKTANIYNGLPNQGEIEPLFLSLANDGAKTAVFELRTGPTVAGTPNFAVSGAGLLSLIDTAGAAVSSDGTLVATYTVAKGTTLLVNLATLEIRIPPSLRLVVSGYFVGAGSAADLSAAITWYEDI
jgi:hypothetical protein